MISGRYFLEEFKLDNTIPLLVVKNLKFEEKTLPAVIVVHGLASAKERNLTFAMNLADNGFLVLLPDVYNHGDRGSPTFLTDLFTNPLVTIFDAIANTIDDIIRIVDYICEERKDADCEAIGITGISLGGLITFTTGIQEHRIKVLVPIISSGDFLTIIQESSLTKAIYNVNKTEKQEKTLPAGLKNILTQLDPVFNASKFFPRPLLLINGENDTVFPAKAVTRTVNALKKAYSANPSLFKHIIFSGVGHTVTQDMKSAAVEFFKEHLKQR